MGFRLQTPHYSTPQRLANFTEVMKSLAPINVKDYYAEGTDTSSDYVPVKNALAAAEAAIDAGAPGARVWFPRGVYRGDTVTTAGGITYIWGHSRSNIHLDFEPGAVLKTTADAALLFITGAGKPSGIANWANFWLGDATKATYYAMSPVIRGDRTITLVTAAQASNLPVGAWIYLRCGQCNDTTVTEPDAELNQVISSNSGTGLIGLRWPVGKGFQAENFLSGSAGKSAPGAPGTATVFGVANVSDRVIENSRITNLTIDAQNCQGSALRVELGVVGSVIEGLRGISGGSILDCIETRGFRYRDWKVRSKRVTGTAARWIAAAGTGCSDGLVEDIDAAGEGNSMLYMHVHEGTRDAVYRDVKIVSPVGADDHTPFSVRARSGNITVDGLNVISAGTQSPVFVSDECPGGGEFRNVSAKCATAGKGILITSPGWKVRNADPATTVRQTGTALRPAVPSTTPEWLTGILTFDNTTINLGTLPLNTVVLWQLISLSCDVAFNGGTSNRVTIGWAASPSAIVASAAALDLGTTGRKDIAATALGAFAGTRNTVERVLQAVYTAGGAPAPTTGKATIMVPFMHVPELA